MQYIAGLVRSHRHNPPAAHPPHQHSPSTAHPPHRHHHTHAMSQACFFRDQSERQLHDACRQGDADEAYDLMCAYPFSKVALSQALHTAIDNGRLDSARVMIECRRTPVHNFYFHPFLESKPTYAPKFMTPLSLAARSQQIEVVRLLLRASKACVLSCTEMNLGQGCIMLTPAMIAAKSCIFTAQLSNIPEPARLVARRQRAIDILDAILDADNGAASLMPWKGFYEEYDALAYAVLSLPRLPKAHKAASGIIAESAGRVCRRLLIGGANRHHKLRHNSGDVTMTTEQWARQILPAKHPVIRAFDTCPDYWERKNHWQGHTAGMRAAVRDMLCVQKRVAGAGKLPTMPQEMYMCIMAFTTSFDFRRY